VCVKVKDRTAELTTNQTAPSHLSLLQPREGHSLEVLIAVFINWCGGGGREASSSFAMFYTEYSVSGGVTET